MSSRQTKNKISEFSLIKKYFAPLVGEGSFNLDDDAAKIQPSANTSLVITQDALAEDVHFFGDDAPDLIAKKALRVNLSDLAAKGAVPKYFSLALGLGKTWNENWVQQFAKGLSEDIKHYDVQLTGGDTFTTGAGFVISITAIGEVPSGKYVSRLGAKEGDLIYVTGTIGDGALGLIARQNKLAKVSKTQCYELIDRYLLPQPRTDFEQAIQGYASASMDVSDGLVGDLEKLCKVSGVGAVLKADNIPLSKAAKSVVESDSKYLKIALTGGDDYEILLTIPKKKQTAFEAFVERFDYNISCIGEITQGSGVQVFDSQNKTVKFDTTSYDHSGDKS